MKNFIKGTLKGCNILFTALLAMTGFATLVSLFGRLIMTRTLSKKTLIRELKRMFLPMY